MTRTRRPQRARATAAFATAALAVLILVPSSALAATDFPPGYTGYHTYAEIAALTKSVADAHPDIARRFSIGKSYQGRELWAMKISDHVAIDENEPEVLFDGGHHADEHMGVEMVLKIMTWLVSGYGRDTRITNIVNGREIWLVFSMNPDGAEYDIANGHFHFWRKNRQPTPGTPYRGTDLNRNYGYRWGGGGRTSTNPQAITYRGPSAFSAPETRAMRDFLASRVVNGKQQIRTHITFHETGRLVMWPYGYTYADVPPDMTVQDHLAFVHMGRYMAATNGYRPEQASDLYITSGTTRDYAYGVYRIFSYTFEMSNRDYMDDSLIASETNRNKNAVLYLAERAWCPYAVIGVAFATARCGAFDDDFEAARGWVTNPDGTDTATSGAWQRGNPAGTASNGSKQLDVVPSGSRALTTGLVAGTTVNANDLDGRTTVRSVPISLPSTTGQRLFFRYVFAHAANSTAEDRFVVSIEDAGGARTPVFTRTGSATDVDGVWRSVYVPLEAWKGQTIRIYFEAADGGADSTIEAQVDDVRVTRGS